MSAPEFHRPERVETIGEQPREVAIAANNAERATLAKRFDLLSIEQLEARFTVTRQGEAMIASGRVVAAVTQACAATGVALPAHVDEAVELRFVADGAAAEELELSPDALDTLPIEDGAIDLGEAAAETMALALDPFARAPDADTVLAAAGVIDEEAAARLAQAAGPFGGLADLKRKLES